MIHYATCSYYDLSFTSLIAPKRVQVTLFAFIALKSAILSCANIYTFRMYALMQSPSYALNYEYRLRKTYSNERKRWIYIKMNLLTWNMRGSLATSLLAHRDYKFEREINLHISAHGRLKNFLFDCRHVKNK